MEIKIYDAIYDNDAYISGIIIGQQNDEFIVLWDNDIIGRVKESYSEIKVVIHFNFKKFIIEDILHTGNHGTAYESKVGEKYNRRRGKLLLLDINKLNTVNECLEFNLFDIYEFNEAINGQLDELVRKVLITTPFKSLYTSGDYTMLRTLNSIYKLKEI